MASLLSIIISLVVLLLIIFIKDIEGRKAKNTYRSTLYYKLTNFNRVLIIVSILIFIVVTIIDYNMNSYTRSWTSFITVVLNGLSVAVLSLPMSLSNLYKTIFNDEEELLDIKYVVTNKYDRQKIYNFNKAGIDVIILSKEDLKTKIKKITEKSFKKNSINGNLIITTDNRRIVKDIPNAIYEFDSLNSCYKRIENARGKADKIARIIKYCLLTYIPLILLYFLIAITKFPLVYNILISLLIKLLTIMTVEYVYKKMPNDTDLMNRKPIVNGKIIGLQEIMFILFTCLCALFCYSLPYQYIAYAGGTVSLGLSLILVTFLFNNIFITYSLYSESALAKNIIKALKSIRTTSYVIILIIISILLNFIKFLGTKNIGIQNFIVCIVLGLIPILVLEIVKFARFTTTKGTKKNVRKNNKKHQKS